MYGRIERQRRAGRILGEWQRPLEDMGVAKS
jgi:hypothetical protein